MRRPMLDRLIVFQKTGIGAEFLRGKINVWVADNQFTVFCIACLICSSYVHLLFKNIHLWAGSRISSMTLGNWDSALSLFQFGSTTNKEKQSHCHHSLLSQVTKKKRSRTNLKQSRKKDYYLQNVSTCVQSLFAAKIIIWKTKQRLIWKSGFAVINEPHHCDTQQISSLGHTGFSESL